MKQYHAYRTMKHNGMVLYVESLETKGDPYSYTGKVDNAMVLSEEQAKAFCNYMRECDAVGQMVKIN